MRRNVPLPDSAHLLGAYQGINLYYQFMPRAQFSDRAVVYVYARPDGEEGVAFVQVTAVRRSTVDGLEEHDVERRLTIDALCRAKNRILEHSFEWGEAYTIELNEHGVRRSFRAA